MKLSKTTFYWGLAFNFLFLAGAQASNDYVCQSLHYSTSYGVHLTIDTNEEDIVIADIEYNITIGSKEKWATEIRFDEETHSYLGKNFSLVPESLAKNGEFSGQLKISRGLARFVGPVVCHPNSRDDQF